MQPVPAFDASEVRSRPDRRRIRHALRPLLALALVGAGLTAAPAAGTAAPDVGPATVNPYQRGPNPTVASIEATRGPFATAQTTIAASSVSGFRGGTVYYPTSTAEGTFGAVAISPGFTATQSSVAWLGPRLASQGSSSPSTRCPATTSRPAGAPNCWPPWTT